MKLHGIKKAGRLPALILFPVFFVFLLMGVSSFIFPKGPQAHHGILDLSRWDFQKDGLVTLDGEWEFYWQRLLTHRDFQHWTALPKSYQAVPNMWNRYRLQGRSLPGYGYATYRLKIKLPDGVSRQGLKIPTMSTAYKLMVAQAVGAANGTVGASRNAFAPEYRPEVYFFQAKSHQLEIIVQVANFVYARGGLCHSIFLGTASQIKALWEETRQWEMFLLGAIFIMILYHAALYILQKRYRYRAELYFILMMILFVVRIMCRGEYLILNLFPGLSLKWTVFFEYLPIFWALPALALFMQEFYPEECSPQMLKWVLAVAAFFTLTTLVTPLSFYTRFTLLIEIVLLGLSLYYIAAAWRATVHNRTGAALLFSAIIFSIGAFILEASYHWNIFNRCFEEGVFPMVSFVYIFIQSFILAQRSSTAFTAVETLSQKLISLDKLKDDYLANTSHELRTPLHGMITITESVLENAAAQLPGEQQENLALVVASGKRLANLINDILDYEKLKHGDLKLNKRNLDIRPVIATALEVSRYLSFGKPVRFVSQLPESLPEVAADEERLTQIVYNLLGNAIKFTEAGTITVAAALTGNMVEVCVADTGIGIPADKIDTIFKSFEQLDTPAGNFGGTGLGLSITKYLVEIHGGKIQAASIPGQGSQFTFSIPVSVNTTAPPVQNETFDGRSNPPENAGAVLPMPGTPPDQIQNGTFNILLVDDDYVNLRALRNIVAAEGYGAITATNGPDALEILARQPRIDLVILDIMLPGMSGYEVCQKIRENYSHFELPVLLMTAKNSSQSMIAGFAAGANDFLSKPCDTSELKARMKTLLHLKQSVSQALQAELAFLQAQIKPHFLYNALNTIMSFCWSDPEKTESLLVALSDYLRGSFNFTNLDQFIPLEKELEFVKAYIDIEKARFEEKLTCRFEIAVPLDVMIPTLMLQPLVENAIKHGILPKTGGGTVTISIARQDAALQITVADDGLGIPPDKLIAVQAGLANQGVGLTNINRRLKRLYGYGVEITSTMMHGTVVRLKIPERGSE